MKNLNWKIVASIAALLLVVILGIVVVILGPKADPAPVSAPPVIVESDTTMTPTPAPTAESTTNPKDVPTDDGKTDAATAHIMAALPFIVEGFGLLGNYDSQADAGARTQTLATHFTDAPLIPAIATENSNGTPYSATTHVITALSPQPAVSFVYYGTYADVRLVYQYSKNIISEDGTSSLSTGSVTWVMSIPEAYTLNTPLPSFSDAFNSVG